MRRLHTAIVILSIGLFGLSAFSSENQRVSNTKQKKEATAADKKIYNKALDCFKNGEYDTAATLFRQTYASTGVAGLLFNIAQSEALEKKYGRALEMFQRYLSEANSISEEEKIEVYQEIGAIQKNIAHLQVSAPAGCVVKIDDFSRGVAPFPKVIYINASIPQVATVICDNKQVYRSEFTLNTGETKSIEVAPVKIPKKKKVSLSNVAITSVEAMRYSAAKETEAVSKYMGQLTLAMGAGIAAFGTAGFFLANEDYKRVSIGYAGLGVAVMLSSVPWFIVHSNRVNQWRKKGMDRDLSQNEVRYLLEADMKWSKYLSLVLLVPSTTLLGMGLGFYIADLDKKWGYAYWSFSSMGFATVLVTAFRYVKSKRLLKKLNATSVANTKRSAIAPSFAPLQNGGAFVLCGSF